MTEYYSNMNVMSICTKTKYASVIRGDGNSKSNHEEANMELTRQMPSVINQTNFYTYDLEKSK